MPRPPVTAIETAVLAVELPCRGLCPVGSGTLSARYPVAPAYTSRRILPVVVAKDAVEVGGALLQGLRGGRRTPGGHGEELGLVAGSVGAKERLVTLLGEAAQSLGFPEADLYLLGELVAVGKGRGAVGGPVERVNLMGELIDHVVPLLGGGHAPWRTASQARITGRQEKARHRMGPGWRREGGRIWKKTQVCPGIR